MKSSLKDWGSALRSRLALRNDQGIALITVIGAMMVMGIVVTIIVAATSSTVRTTTVTRSDVQSKASAEAGVAYVQSLIANDSCAAPGGSVTAPAGFPKFEAEIFWTSSGTATELSTQGCPTAAATSVLVRSTGTADSAGVGDSRNNKNSVEALFNYATTPQFALDNAIFTGQNMTFNNLVKVLRDPAAPSVPADVYTGGAKYTCNAGSRIEGSVYLKGGDNPMLGSFNNESGECTITGDLVARTNVVCTGGMNVGGNAFSQRSVTLEGPQCKIVGDVGVGDKMKSSGYSAGGNVQVNGAYEQSNSAVTVGGKLFLAGSKQFNTNWETVNPTKVVHPAPTATIPNVPDKQLPQLDEAWINANFAGWARPGWKSTLEPIRKANWVNVCDMGSNTMNTLTITQDTVLDARSDCGDTVKIGGSLEIELKANLAILGSTIHKVGDLKIVSGDSSEHEIYFISPWSAGATCDASSTNMVWGWGKHSQPDGLTRAFLYTPSGFKTDSSHQIRGQIYACQANFSTPQEITYAPVTGLGGINAGGATGLTMLYQQDIS